MARKGLADLLLEAGSRFVAKAADVVMNDRRGKEAVATAVGLAQRGRKRLEAAQETLLRAAGVPGRQEYEDLNRQLARIKRKARELSEKLDGAALEEEEERHEERGGSHGPNGGGTPDAR
jgi:hypothetical protein